MGAAIEVERLLGELGETPFEPLKEKQEEGMAEMSTKNQVAALNSTLINFFKGSVPNPISSFSPAMFIECQICEGRDHIAMTCPRLNAPWPKCARCGGPHRIENCGVKCPFYLGLGHSKDRCWRKHNERRSHFGAANFLEMLLDDEEAITTVEDKIYEQQHVDELVGMMEGINIVIGRKWQDAVEPYEEPRTGINDTKGEQVDASEDRIYAKAVEAAEEMDSIHEEATVQRDQAPLVEDINIKRKRDSEMEEPFTSVLPPSAV